MSLILVSIHVGTKSLVNFYLVSFALFFFLCASAASHTHTHTHIPKGFAQSGQVQIADDSTYSYRYNVTGENQNLLSLGSVSADRFPEEITQYPTLDKYETYYENVKYGDVWIRAAFQAGVTDLKRGQASFSNMNVEGRVGTLTQNGWGRGGVGGERRVVVFVIVVALTRFGVEHLSRVVSVMLLCS